ncbi:MAG: hypothetical protein NZ552_02135 [Planctomycetes bacterium]|nr:hypothetical protein [Planctomycetota bacterium]
MLRVLGLGAGLASALAGASPAALEPGPGGVWPRLLIASSNDLFGNGLGNGDDFRTAGAAAQLRLGPLLLVGDAALLTDRSGGTRCDVVFGGALWRWGGEATRLGWSATAAVGGGVRAAGSLGGAEIQNRVHRLLGIAGVSLAYDGDLTASPALLAAAAGGWWSPAPLGTGWWGWEFVACGSAVGDGERQLTAGPRWVLLGQEGSWWLAAYRQWWDGEPPRATLATVASRESGWWAEIGSDAVPWGRGPRAWGYRVRSAWNPQTRAALGSVGVVWAPGVAGAGAELWLEHELALYTGGGLGVQLRWRPWPWQDSGRWCGPLLDYRFGTEPAGRHLLDLGSGEAPAEADLRHDQLSIGWEEAWRSPPHGRWRAIPFVQASSGLRQEGLVVIGQRRVQHSTRATTIALRGGCGLRAEWAETLSLGLSWEGWLPAWRETLSAPPLVVTLNDAGWAWGAQLAALLAW